MDKRLGSEGLELGGGRWRGSRGGGGGLKHGCSLVPSHRSWVRDAPERKKRLQTRQTDSWRV